MNSVLKRKTLILNTDGRPLSTWPLSLIMATDAVHGVCRDRLIVLEEWKDEYFRSPSIQIPVPKTAMLRHYAKVGGAPKFCRRSVLLRDRYCCQYCGNRFESQDLTFDHYVPRADNGKTTWDNILMACIGCNAAKANRRDMKPLKLPRRPTHMELLAAGLEFLPNDIRESWGDYLYWNVELDP